MSILFVWVFAAVVVFLLSLVIAIISVEREKRMEDKEEEVLDRGDAAFLVKKVEKVELGHGRTKAVLEPDEKIELGQGPEREILQPQDPIGMLDDKAHTHTQITEVDDKDDEDEVIPRYLEEEQNDREQSKKLAGEIDL